MDNTGTCCHPLYITRAYNPAVLKAVPMFNSAVKHVCNSFNTSVRVPWETFNKLFRAVTAKIIEKKKRVKIRELVISENPVQMNAGTFHCRYSRKHSFYFTGFHGFLLPDLICRNRTIFYQG
jgi:hypothetical protein